MSDGLNLDGFNTTKPSAPTPWSNNEQYAQDPKAAFSATDMSTQGNAGLNAEGSSAANESANDASERM